MKRVLVLAFLPIMLFGLETVNLIKDAGFEKDSDVWLMESVIYGSEDYDSTEINRHDPDSAYTGNYCGSIDTRTKPAPALPSDCAIVGILSQIPITSKRLEDLDSLEVNHMIVFSFEGMKNSCSFYGVSLIFSVPSQQSTTVTYRWNAPDLAPMPDDDDDKFFQDTILTEGVWFNLKRDLIADIADEKGLPLDAELDTFLFYGFSYISTMIWRGQKTFFDGIRLMGYADYDVGVKEILSGDSLEVGTPYVPVARIKNFGRENADSFLVIAEIKDGASIIYVDTLPWTLEGDTEDTVTFADFDPPTTGPYTLTVRTFMTPDECDEDDEMSKEIGHSSVSESPLPEGLSLEVRSIVSPLQVFYSLPYGESGTLTLYDATGRRIERMAVKGSGRVEFGAGLASGVYLVRLETSSLSITRKAVVLR